MKKYLPLSILMFSVFRISAQITVTNTTFPEAGDTLKVAFDYTPSGIMALTPPGGNQHWDFSSLEVDETQEIIFRPAGEGSVGGQVKGAALFAELSPGTETYYHVTPTSFEMQAYYGIAPYDIVENRLFEYHNTFPERHAPLNFFDVRGASTVLSEYLWPTDFSPQLMINLAAVTGNAQIVEMRYRVATNRQYVVDGWGTLSIPGGTYEVLREKRVQYKETRIDGYIPPLGWLDIADVCIMAGFNGLGVDTIVTFHYYNDVTKEPIAIVTVNNEQNAATQVQFKHTQLVNAVEETDVANPSVTVSPNPAVDEVGVRLHNLSPGHYRLVIYDERGRIVDQQTMLTSGHDQEQINLSGLMPGIYVLTVMDRHDRIWCREKLIKVGY